MKTLKLGLAGIALMSAFAMGTAQAEIKLNDISEVAGSWLLESVAPGLTKPKVPENRTWDFKADGTLVVTGFNRHFNRDDEQKFNYKVVNGGLQFMTLGGGSKPQEYKVYEKTGDSMILQGGLEGFYFFKKK